MSIKTVLFDLDGTLLPMDLDVFIKAYFGGLVKKLVPFGYDAQTLIGAVKKGTDAMIRNHGEKTNEQVFWDTFSGILGENVRKDEPYFDEFYRNEFQNVKAVCGYNPEAKKAIEFIKQNGLQMIVATNPLFPKIAVESRIKWAGLDPDDFVTYTSYENSRFCKPNLDYYKEILKENNLEPQECLMVGNDVDEDMIAQKLGLQVFLLTDNLINNTNQDIRCYPNGNFKDLMKFIKDN